MILSFHPCFEGDKDIICAGRDPDADDLTAIRSADAIILPQGCRESLHKMAKENCRNVFPNYDARFQYPGKLKQTELFQVMNAPFPETKIFKDMDRFSRQKKELNNQRAFDLPFVFKFDWGGEGDFVYFIESLDQLEKILELAENYERSGQKGFLIQQFIPGINRTLRVVVIHKRIISYWRVHKEKGFRASLSKGAVIDKNSDPDLQSEAKKRVKEFCRKTKINLAGFDLIFSKESETPKPFFLEINYFFGRKGLGGSERYYDLLTKEIMLWIKRNGLTYLKQLNRQK